MILFVIMVQPKTMRSLIKRYSLSGSLIVAAIIISVVLIEKAQPTSDAYANKVLDESVVSEDIPKAVVNDQIDSFAGVEIEDSESKPLISTYTVKEGDTISSIAQSFGVSANTVRWANDLSAKSVIKVGDELVILPFTGIKYTVKKGDTLSAITVKYGGDKNEIMNINGLESEKQIKPGDTLLIPDGEMPTVEQSKKSISTTESKSVTKVETKKVTATVKTQTKPIVDTKDTEVVKETTDTPVKATEAVLNTVKAAESIVTENKTEENKKDDNKESVRFISPITNAILTQGIHDGNAVDFGVAVGTSVKAAAAGTVMIAKSSGYNGGYGSYIVISHSDGAQTLYGHLSKVSVTVGQKVDQGELIGLSGNSGRSTGPHLHYKEIGTGTKNTFAKFKTGTAF